MGFFFEVYTFFLIKLFSRYPNATVNISVRISVYLYYVKQIDIPVLQIMYNIWNRQSVIYIQSA